MTYFCLNINFYTYTYYLYTYTYRFNIDSGRKCSVKKVLGIRYTDFRVQYILEKCQYLLLIHISACGF